MTNPSAPADNQATVSPSKYPAEIQRIVENHTKIANHLETAAKHHLEAAKHHQAGDAEKAEINTTSANEHHNKATELQKIIAEAHIEMPIS